LSRTGTVRPVAEEFEPASGPTVFRNLDSWGSLTVWETFRFRAGLWNIYSRRNNDVF